MSRWLCCLLAFTALAATRAICAQGFSHEWSRGFGDAFLQRGNAVAIDSSANVVLGGEFTGVIDFGGGPLASTGDPVTGLLDVFFAKFDSDGHHLWSRKSSGISHEFLADMAIDAAGNIVALGRFYGEADLGSGSMTSEGSLDIFLAKFDPSGSPLWSRPYGGINNQYAIDMAVDACSNVILVGYFNEILGFGSDHITSSGGMDAFVAKVDSNGTHLWSKSFGDAEGQNATCVALNTSGEVVIAGAFDGTIDLGGGVLEDAGGSDLFVAKFAADGTHLWSRCYGDENQQYPSCILAGPSDEITLVGFFLGAVDFGGGPLVSAGGTDIFVARLDSYGNHIWSASFGSVGGQFPRNATIDDRGTLTVVGEFTDQVDFGNGALFSAGGKDFFVAQFDSTGLIMWSSEYGDVSDEESIRIATDASGAIVLVGGFQTMVDFGEAPIVSTGSFDAFVARFEASAIYAAAPSPSAGRPILSGAWPNPFNPSTRIQYTIPAPGPVSISIYDMIGRQVRALVSGEMRAAGCHSNEWDGTDDNGHPVASGQYLIRLQSRDGAVGRKVLLAK